MPSTINFVTPGPVIPPFLGRLETVSWAGLAESAAHVTSVAPTAGPVVDPACASDENVINVVDSLCTSQVQVL